MAIKRKNSNQRMSQIVSHNGVVYLSGQVAHDLSGDIANQTAEALAEIDRHLAEAGSDKSKLLSVTIYLANISADFAGMNAVWDGWIQSGATPARATVQAALYDPKALVEISVIAAQ